MARVALPFVALLVLTGSPGCKAKEATPKSKSDATASAKAQADESERLVYPEARVSDHVDELHGEQVADPFRWLEDSESKETKAWIAAQNKLTFSYLEKIDARQTIAEKLKKLWNYERFDTPWSKAGRYFFSRNDGLQNQSVLYWTQDLKAEPKVLIDPNQWSKDGTASLSMVSVSDDGKLLAYGRSEAGSDWEQWRVKNIETGEELGDELKWIKFGSASWTPDNKGFYYGAYDEPAAGQELQSANYYQKLYYHRLGDPQSKDRLVYEDKEHKERQFWGDVTEDGRYLIIDVSEGTERKNRVFYKDLSKPAGPVVKLLDQYDASYSFVGNEGPVFWFKTDLEAPKKRLVAIDTRKPNPTEWKSVIPEGEDPIRSISLVGDRFLVRFLKDATSTAAVYGLDGKKEADIDLPGIGSAGGFSGKRTDKETFYRFTNFTHPGSIYRYDIESGKSELFRQPKVAFEAERYKTTQVFFESKDGTKIPMFIVHKKGLQLDGNQPTYLYGYGGYNISLTPSFSVANLAWLEMGGVYAQANLRGGGEYGEAWHQAGIKLKKQNTFDDFIAAAEYLVAHKYTRRERLAIGGRSNGGLLVGAAMTQRPDLFGAVLAGVGVMDMLRFHKFTVGWAWVSDFGSPDDPEEFKAIYAYSPYHNLKAKTAYPATLVFTADHDDRVVPAHSYKFAAQLQRFHEGSAPVLIRIDTKSGHGSGKPVSKRIEEWADLWGFLAENLKMELPTSKAG